MKIAFAILLALFSTTAIAGRDSASAFISSLDENRDGKVSQEEFLKPSIDEFDKIDRNGDGGIDSSEAEIYIKQMRTLLELRMQQRKMQNK